MPVSLEVIAGPMFSGKTERLIQRINRATWRRKQVVAVKPLIDSRTEDFIASRAIVDGESRIVARYPARVIAKQEELAAIIDAWPAVLAINEGQFFDPWLLEIVRAALKTRHSRKMRIIVDGLDRDYRRQPFGGIPQLLLEADKVLKLLGVCMRCGSKDGTFTQRLIRDERQIVVGDYKAYQVRCRMCHYIPGEEPEPAI